jgi:hypothetical protein
MFDRKPVKKRSGSGLAPQPGYPYPTVLKTKTPPRPSSTNQASLQGYGNSIQLPSNSSRKPLHRLVFSPTT